jgi:hypothetical protein
LSFGDHSGSDLFLNVFLFKQLVFDKFLPLMIAKLALPIFVKGPERALFVPGLLVFMLYTKEAFMCAA